MRNLEKTVLWKLSFKDYQLKSAIGISIHGLMTSGETVEKGHFETELLFVFFSNFEIIHLLISKSMLLIARHQ